MDKVTQGQDIIINSLGATTLKGVGSDLCSKGTEIIIKSMKLNSIKRIITCSSLGVGDSY